MKKLGWVGVAVGALLLAGCSAATGDAQTAPSAEAPSSAPKVNETTAPSATPTAAAIEMEAAPATDPSTPWGEAGFESGEAWYLASMESTWQGEPRTDAELIGAGMLACEQLATGAVLESITVVAGDTDDALLNNSRAVTYAQMALCP